MTERCPGVFVSSPSPPICPLLYHSFRHAEYFYRIENAPAIFSSRVQVLPSILLLISLSYYLGASSFRTPSPRRRLLFLARSPFSPITYSVPFYHPSRICFPPGRIRHLYVPPRMCFFTKGVIGSRHLTSARLKSRLVSVSLTAPDPPV